MNTSKTYEATKSEELGSLKLTCFSFLQNGKIPPRYTSDGININPSLYMDDIPKEAQSLAILLEDPDVPHDSFCHWLAWNLPVTHYIKEKENRGVSGINDFCNHGYNGPHPFSITHRYQFRVFALDCTLDIPESATKLELKQAMNGHILAYGTVTGTYKRNTRSSRSGAESTSVRVMSEELSMLLNERAPVCVSVFIPLHHASTDGKPDKLQVIKMIRQAFDLLSASGHPESARIMESLKTLQDKITLKKKDRGIGIYISPAFTHYTTFPFEVTERMVIDDHFHIRELLEKEQYAAPYSMVLLDEKEIRLYSGRIDQLREIKNADFPVDLEEVTVLKSPLINSFFARNAYVKTPESIPNGSSQKELWKYLRKADELLDAYLEDSEAVVLCGTRRWLTDFVQHTAHPDKIIHLLFGNYKRFSEDDLGEMIWPFVKRYLDEKNADQFNQFNEKVAEKVTEDGIVRVWDAVASDWAGTILLERNFAVKGYVEYQNPSRLFLHPPGNPHRVCQDAVDELIRMAINNQVKIVFVEDGLLSRNMRIAVAARS